MKVSPNNVFEMLRKLTGETMTIMLHTHVRVNVNVRVTMNIRAKTARL